MQRRSIQAGTVYAFQDYKGTYGTIPALSVDGGTLWSVKAGTWFRSTATRYDTGSWNGSLSGVLVVRRGTDGTTPEEIAEKLKAVKLPEEVTPEAVRDLAKSLDKSLALALVNPMKILADPADWGTYWESRRIGQERHVAALAEVQRLKDRRLDLMAKVQEKADLGPFAEVGLDGTVKVSLPFLAQLLGVETDLEAVEQLRGVAPAEERDSLRVIPEDPGQLSARDLVEQLLATVLPDRGDDIEALMKAVDAYAAQSRREV